MPSGYQWRFLALSLPVAFYTVQSIILSTRCSVKTTANASVRIYRWVFRETSFDCGFYLHVKMPIFDGDFFRLVRFLPRLTASNGWPLSYTRSMPVTPASCGSMYDASKIGGTRYSEAWRKGLAQRVEYQLCRERNMRETQHNTIIESKGHFMSHNEVIPMTRPQRSALPAGDVSM
ncbi:hypothetical protein BJ170DRAFT_591184 [Xylariales sp. AK1849]|nr:hypothetical protein BJ170DRAFT_591184 [Xylariales sp. AK1849]